MLHRWQTMEGTDDSIPAKLSMLGSGFSLRFSFKGWNPLTRNSVIRYLALKPGTAVEISGLSGFHALPLL